MRLNIDCDLVKQLVSGQLRNKSRHLDELTHEPAIWSCDTGQWLSCFDSCQLTILWMSNIKDLDLPRHAWDIPPFLLIVSPTPSVQSVDAYARSITWQPNEKSPANKAHSSERAWNLPGARRGEACVTFLAGGGFNARSRVSFALLSLRKMMDYRSQ